LVYAVLLELGLEVDAVLFDEGCFGHYWGHFARVDLGGDADEVGLGPWCYRRRQNLRLRLLRLTTTRALLPRFLAPHLNNVLLPLEMPAWRLLLVTVFVIVAVVGGFRLCRLHANFITTNS